jgi:hypothetical protein
MLQEANATHGHVDGRQHHSVSVEVNSTAESCFHCEQIYAYKCIGIVPVYIAMKLSFSALLLVLLLLLLLLCTVQV